MGKTAADVIKRWRYDPVSFVKDNFKVDPDAWQIDVLEAFASTDPDKMRISMQACAGPGKSAALAWCGWNFLVCYADEGNHPKGAVVAVTQDNLKDNLWPEFSKWQGRSKLLRHQFTWTKSRIYNKDYPETWFLSARSFSKSADTEEQGRTLSGLHSDYILYLIDESGDIPVPVLRSAEQGLTSCKWGKILQAGNPTSHEGMLYAAATKLRDKWFIVRITGDPDDPKRSPRIDINWAREQISNYGRTDPWVMSYILGQFPPSSLNALLSPEEVEAAMDRYVHESEYSWAEKRLGVDAARFGCFDDKTEILTNKGWKLFENLSGEEKVLSQDIDTEISSWEKIDKVHKYEFDGELNCFENSKADFCVTDNHKFLVRTNRKSKKYCLKEFKDLPLDYVIKGGCKWMGSNSEYIDFKYKLPKPNGGVEHRSYKFSMKDWAEFLGWFVSEGNVYCEKRRNGRKRIIITQKDKNNFHDIQNLLKRMNIKFRITPNGEQIEFSNNFIGQHLIKFCGVKAYNKRVPNYIKDSSEDIINIFLDSFLLGDGNCRKDGNGRAYHSSSKLLIDDLQEMLAKVGRAGKITERAKAGSFFYIGDRKVIRNNNTYTLYERRSGKYEIKHRDRFLDKRKVKKVKYKGNVWCVSTKHRTIFVRRNGVPIWSGNSDSWVIFPRQGKVAFKPVELRNPRSEEVAARVAYAKSKWGSDIEAFDGTGGYASGAVDAMHAAGHSPVEINFSGKAPDPRYYNMRSYMWFEMAEWVKKGGALPRNATLMKELTAPQYTYKGGKFILEEKEQIKKRLGFSTNFGDALCLTFFQPDMPAKEKTLADYEKRIGRETGKLLHEFDPYSEKNE